VAEGRQRFVKMWVGDVLGEVAFRVGVEGVQLGLLAAQQQDRHLTFPSSSGSVDRGPS
jgi:hypothetical protein